MLFSFVFRVKDTKNYYNIVGCKLQYATPERMVQEPIFPLFIPKNNYILTKKRRKEQKIKTEVV